MVASLSQLASPSRFSTAATRFASSSSRVSRWSKRSRSSASSIFISRMSSEFFRMSSELAPLSNCGAERTCRPRGTTNDAGAPSAMILQTSQGWTDRHQCAISRASCSTNAWTNPTRSLASLRDAGRCSRSGTTSSFLKTWSSPHSLSLGVRTVQNGSSGE